MGRKVGLAEWLVGIAIAFTVVGCSGGGDEASTALKEQDAKAVKVTTPDATAEDNAKALAAADMDPEVKKVLGGAGR